MQAHARIAFIEVHQASFRRGRIAGKLFPQRQNLRRHIRPGLGRVGVQRLVAIPLRLIRHPAERAEIRHPHAHRLARFGHARHVERPGPQAREHRVAQLLLRGAGKLARPQFEPVEIGACAAHHPGPIRLFGFFFVPPIRSRPPALRYFPATNAAKALRPLSDTPHEPGNRRAQGSEKALVPRNI